MGFGCRKAALLVAMAIVACTGPSEPSAISAHFILTDVDGHALPIASPPSIGIPGPTIVSGTMSLDQAGGAVIAEDRIDPGGAHYTFTSSYTYVVKDSNIKFAYPVPCPSNANCAPPPTGAILDNGLRVQVLYPPGYVFHLYNYRVSATP